MRIKVIYVLGTRPEAIKMAPIIIEGKSHKKINGTVLCSGQHREMAYQALNIFDLRPDEDLGVMKHGQSLAALTSTLVLKIDRYLKRLKPDLIIVQGDTTTAYAAALVGFYNSIAVAHVEAGLRTGNMQAPFPEEANRVCISRLADIHFAPTNSAKENLLREGVKEQQLYVTGNTVVDALNIIKRNSKRSSEVVMEFPQSVLKREAQNILITGHRRENWGTGLRNICEAVTELSLKFPKASFVFPVHPNPIVANAVSSQLKSIKNVFLIGPVDYVEMLRLLAICDLVITDSGGIQEEAPSFGTPVLVTRDVTERPEGVALGLAAIVGTNSEKIVNESIRILNKGKKSASDASVVNPYGDGYASKRIIDIVVSRFEEKH